MSHNWNVLGQLPKQLNAESTSAIYAQIIQTLLDVRQIEDQDGFLKSQTVDDILLAEIHASVGTSVDTAIELIKTTMQQGGSIVIHGDYDVDGVSATAILWETLYYDFEYRHVYPFIPHRVDHGYGLSPASIDDIRKMLQEKGEEPGLLITVDCGVTAKSAVEYAKSAGFNVLVTDHHTLPDSESDYPNADAIVHTYQLCGAGISWLVANSLRHSAHKEIAGTDLVALATLADLQSLSGFNRVLVRQGLAELSQTKRSGLRSLYDIAGITGKAIGTYEVGWVIAPRLNATGRLDHALDALRLLIARNPAQGLELATKLNELNIKRQKMTEAAVAQAVEMGRADRQEGTPVIVSHADWHEGIIGLIAAKLVGTFNAPAIAIAETPEGAKGSARSLTGFNIVDILRESADLMTGVGGHEMAAGFSLPKENIPVLKERIRSVNLSERTEASLLDQLNADLELQPSWISWDLFQILEQLAPHGVGNPPPLFVSRGMVVEDKRTVGKSASHLKLRLNGLSTIGFGLGHLLPSITIGEPIDILYSIERDDFYGGQNIQLKLKDIAV